MTPGARLFRTLTIAASLGAVPQVALAGDEIRANADVTTTGGYSSNPFAGTGKNLGNAYVQIDADPQVRLIAERSVLALKARIDYRHYFHSRSDTSDYQGGLDYLGMPSSRLTTHANANYDSSIIGGFEAIAPVINPAQPPPPPKTGNDLTLFGTGTRRRTLELGGDVAYILSARASLTVNGFYSRARYSAFAGQSNYDGYGGGAGYSRRLSDHLRLGVQTSVNRYVFQGLFGQSQVYSLQTTVSNDFNSHWSLKGAIGVSYSDRTVGGKTTTPSGNLQLCRHGDRTNLCATVSEAVLPTGFSGAVVTQSTGATYSYQLSEHARFSLSADYSHNNKPVSGNTIHTVAFGSSYVTATATYDRTLRQRLHFIATTRYRNISSGAANRPADFGGTIGFLVRLGEYR